MRDNGFCVRLNFGRTVSSKRISRTKIFPSCRGIELSCLHILPNSDSPCTLIFWLGWKLIQKCFCFSLCSEREPHGKHRINSGEKIFKGGKKEHGKAKKKFSRPMIIYQMAVMGSQSCK